MIGRNPQPFRWIISLKHSSIRYHAEHNSKNLSFSSIYSLINPFPPSISHILVLLPFPFAITNGCLALIFHSLPSKLHPTPPQNQLPLVLAYIFCCSWMCLLFCISPFVSYILWTYSTALRFLFHTRSTLRSIVTIAPLPSHDEQPW